LMEWMAPAPGIAMCHIGCCHTKPMKGAIHDGDYHGRAGSGRERVSGSRGRRRRGGCRQTTSPASAGAGVLLSPVAVPDRPRSLRRSAFPGAGTDEARP
jgi:hypothetical protein